MPTTKTIQYLKVCKELFVFPENSKKSNLFYFLFMHVDEPARISSDDDAEPAAEPAAAAAAADPGDFITHTCVHNVDNSPDALDDSRWTRRNDANPGPAPSVQPGLTTQPPADAGVEYFIGLFLPHAVFELLVRETNRYAEQYIASNPDLPPHARAKSWKPITVPDMKKFIAIYLLSGIVRKSQLQQYWSTDSFSGTPGFARIMKRDKFLGILQFLHFADNNDAVPGDRLAKLSPLTDMLTDIFKRTYVPQQFISIDEELVLFKGRLLFKQYIRSKRARFSVKVFALCDTSGYYWSASFYTGRPANPLPHTAQLGSTGAIVVHLMGELLGKGYHVYLDNWYTSLDLATYLKVNTTGMCGTMRANRRGIPNELKTLDFPKAQYAFRRKGALLLVK